jgi:hypothetical protein
MVVLVVLSLWLSLCLPLLPHLCYMPHPSFCIRYIKSLHSCANVSMTLHESVDLVDEA